MHGFIWGLTVLFHWPICLFLCPYITVLITISLQYSLKSGNEIRSPYIFVKITFTVWSLSCFHISFRIFFFYFSKKNCHWNLDRDCIESIDSMNSTDILTMINSSNLWTQDIFPFTCLLQFLSLMPQSYLIMVYDHCKMLLNLVDYWETLHSSGILACISFSYNVLVWLWYQSYAGKMSSGLLSPPPQSPFLNLVLKSVLFLCSLSRPCPFSQPNGKKVDVI